MGCSRVAVPSNANAREPGRRLVSQAYPNVGSPVRRVRLGPRRQCILLQAPPSYLSCTLRSRRAQCPQTKALHYSGEEAAQRAGCGRMQGVLDGGVRRDLNGRYVERYGLIDPPFPMTEPSRLLRGPRVALRAGPPADPGPPGLRFLLRLSSPPKGTSTYTHSRKYVPKTPGRVGGRLRLQVRRVNTPPATSLCNFDRRTTKEGLGLE